MNEDARTLSASAQEGKRKQAVGLHKSGNNYKSIAELVGVHHLTVGRWIRAYKAKGISALNAKTKGRKMGTGRSLTKEQEKLIQKLIKGKTPDQLKLDYVLWTRKSVQEIVKQETGVILAIRTVGKYLALWGFTLKSR